MSQTLQMTSQYANFQPHMLSMNAKFVQNNGKRATQKMNSLAVDPVLLYAKLEVAKMEQDAARRSAKEREQQRATRKQLEAARRRSLEDLRARQRESLRLSLPVDAEFTADGKPCFNTAMLLAALDAAGPVRHDSLRKAAVSRDRAKKKKHDSQDSSRGNSDNDVVANLEDTITGKQRRRFKSPEEGATKLVRTKHGSQTAWEKVDVPAPEESELLEDQDEFAIRPRLGHDRPHWAQQSQNSTQMQQLRTMIRRSQQRQSNLPAMPVEVDQPPLRRRASFNAREGQTSNTMIADAVREIKKEQKVKKRHTISSLFKRAAS